MVTIKKIVFFTTSFLGVSCISDADTSDSSEVQAEEQEQSSAYGSCSLDLVAASGMTFTATTIDASDVQVQLAFLDEDIGEQFEAHPMNNTEEASPNSWRLDLEIAATPDDVLLGQSTLWSGSLFDPIDKLFVAFNTEGEVCDCWSISSEYGKLNCSLFE